MMGFKSNTTKGGGGYNEIVIRDGKAGELVRIHAQKDMDTTVRNNDMQHVMVDRTISVDGKHTETVKGDMTTSVTEGNQSNTVKAGDQSNTVTAGDQTTTVKGTQTNTVQSGSQVNEVTSGDQANVVKAGAMAHTAKQSIVIQCESGPVRIEAFNKIEIVVGGSSLTMDSGGNIRLAGAKVVIVGTDFINLNP
jgi:type VI secretion system secreted protein VgrG